MALTGNEDWVPCPYSDCDGGTEPGIVLEIGHYPKEGGILVCEACNREMVVLEVTYTMQITVDF